MNRISVALLLTIGLVSFSGCLNSQGNKDKFIKDMIKGGMSVKAKVLRDSAGTLKDMKVFRDGSNDGVVFEYYYAKGVAVDKSKLTEASIKGLMMPQLRGDKNVKYALNMDIYVKVVFKSAEGQVYGQAKISKADL